MKPGDTIEAAIWLSGTETEEQMLRWKNMEVPAALREAEQVYGVRIGPPEFTIKRPGDDRVPPVPAHISGPDVRLLICEAEVYPGKPAIIARQSGFVHDLRPDDLAKLRKITRRACYEKTGQRLTDHQADQIIERLGPDAAVKTLRGDAKVH